MTVSRMSDPTARRPRRLAGRLADGQPEPEPLLLLLPVPAAVRATGWLPGEALGEPSIGERGARGAANTACPSTGSLRPISTRVTIA